jgi:hypothetical protein
MQRSLKVNSVAIRATNATGTGKTSTLKIGDKIIVTVTLSETVVVTGEPTYTISMGGVNKSATYVSTASNANILVFSYTIASGDMTTTGITATTTALSLNAGHSDRLDKPPQSNHLSHHHSHHLHWRLSDHYNHSPPHH